MITLKTLPEATAQQVFDQAKNHLLTQMKHSMPEPGDVDTEVGCLYRGPNGLKCGAGCFISDEEYLPEMDRFLRKSDGTSEGTSWDALHRRGLVPSDHMELIRKLQYVHDNYEPSTWANELLSVAAKFGLQY